MTTSTTSRWNPNFRTRLVSTAFALVTTFFGAIPAANAEPIRIAEDVWSAYDSRNNEHIIKVEFQDRAGDMLIEVSVPAKRLVTEFWIDCRLDVIAEARPDAQWFPVDHRKMEGWYSDVACRLN